MPETEDSIKATIAGVPVGIKGINMLVVVILAVALAGSSYLIWSHMQQERLTNSAEHGGIVDSLDSLQHTQERIGDLLEEQNYIVLSGEEERKAMREQLRRPQSLNKKLEHN